MIVVNRLAEAKKRAQEYNSAVEIFEDAERIEAENKIADKALDKKKSELQAISDEVLALDGKRTAKKKAMLTLDAKVDALNTEIMDKGKESKELTDQVLKTKAAIKRTLANVSVD